MWANRPPIKDGMMEVRTDPGFDVILDEAMVGRYRVD
jgi:L-alanine-DL-glutamate epimerase-like enolase superfamily enzyme